MTEFVDDLAEGALNQALKRVVDGTLSMIWARLKETFIRRPNRLPPAPAHVDQEPAMTEIARERRSDLRAAYAAISPLLRDLVNRIAAAVDVQPDQEGRRERMNALGPAADGLHDAFYQCNALVSARIAAKGDEILQAVRDTWYKLIGSVRSQENWADPMLTAHAIPPLVEQFHELVRAELEGREPVMPEAVPPPGVDIGDLASSDPDGAR